jgi:hypothetical protein
MAHRMAHRAALLAVPSPRTCSLVPGPVLEPEVAGHFRRRAQLLCPVATRPAARTGSVQHQYIRHAGRSPLNRTQAFPTPGTADTLLYVRPMKLRVLSLSVVMVILSPSRLWSEEQDILDSLKGHELGITVQDPQSHRYVPVKYGDPRLARAVQDLSDIPRPWTVPKMINIFRKEREEWPRRIQAFSQQADSDAEEMQRHWSKRFESLARVLAASRNPRAAVILGDTSNTWSPDQALVIMALFDYFVGDMYYGLPPDDKSRSWESFNGLELTLPATFRWWNDNKARLRKEAAALEKCWMNSQVRDGHQAISPTRRSSQPLANVRPHF